MCWLNGEKNKDLEGSIQIYRAERKSVRSWKFLESGKGRGKQGKGLNLGGTLHAGNNGRTISRSTMINDVDHLGKKFSFILKVTQSQRRALYM